MTDERTLSILPSSHRTSPPTPSPRTQKGIHDQRRQTQPRQTSQLSRNRMLRPRRMSRKLARRRQGKFRLNVYPQAANFEDVVKDFFRPIVTPFELQLALQPSPTWTGEYVLDFDQVLARESGQHSRDEGDEDGDPDQPVFSLVTGKYRHAKRYGGEWLLRTLRPY
jgi:hypothetical protein